MLQFNRLRLNGFKSFVEPTDLQIESGLTGIVGPNGCGKSNLIEALRWTMGESSARQLRGGEMEDVIFAGSSSRPSRGFAEVTIDLDNSDASAPPPYSACDILQVSRRIQRDRGSLYRINGREVRARDVQLLFADASSGARSAAIVTQGQVATLISAKAVDRRSYLEEAAGISGLHSRRHEAELKLRAAEVNLQRLEDVLSTLTTQLQNLRRQARQATRYRQISQDIRTAEARLFHRRWREAKTALVTASARLNAAEALSGETSQAVSELDQRRVSASAALPTLRQEDQEAAAALERLRTMHDSLLAEGKRLEADRLAARRRLEETIGDLAREQAQLKDTEATLQRLAAERARLNAATGSEDVARYEAEAALAEVSATLGEIEERMGVLTRGVAEAEARRSVGVRRLEEIDAEQRRLQARLGEAVRQGGEPLPPKPDTDDAEEAAAILAEADATLEAVREALDAVETAQAKAAAAVAEATRLHHTAETARAKLRAEHQALANVIGFEGDAAGAGTVLVDTLGVATGLETALAAALGDDALLPMTGTAPRHWKTLPPLPAIDDFPAGVAPLMARVDAPAALNRRLAHVGLVDDDTTGERLQPELRPGQRLVTADGAVWRWDGFRKPAESATPAAVRMQQRARLADVAASLAEAEARCEESESQLRATREREQQLATALQLHRHQVRNAETAAGQARQAAAAAATAAARAREARARQEERSAALAAATATLKAQIDELAERRETLAAEATLDPELVARQEELRQLAAEVGRWRQAQLDRRSQFDAIVREANGRRRRLDGIASETSAWESRRQQAATKVEVLLARRAATERDVAHLDSLPEEFAQRSQDLNDEMAAAASRADHCRRRLDDSERQLEETDRTLRAAEGRLAAAREERVRAETAAEQAEATLVTIEGQTNERFSLPPERLAELVGEVNEPTTGDLATAEKQLERMKRERDLIGPVNLRAEEELAELEGESGRLDGEREDLLQAIAKLRQGVGQLDKEARARLLAAFDEIDRHFQQLFRRLFGGGHAHLSLMDADDPMAIGLEVMASPPGKKLQHLSLLSGGEQTLTALALRFAIFLAKQTPICVLDEVDAPLDDANVDRMCTLLDDLAAAGTRFLVITHHRLTMARMHRLFGVTMAEKGVSQLVSVDLVDHNGLRSVG